MVMSTPLTKRQWDFIKNYHKATHNSGVYYGVEFTLIFRISHTPTNYSYMVEVELITDGNGSKFSKRLSFCDPTQGTTHIPDDMKSALRKMWDYLNPIFDK